MLGHYHQGKQSLDEVFTAPSAGQLDPSVPEAHQKCDGCRDQRLLYARQASTAPHTTALNRDLGGRRLCSVCAQRLQEYDSRMCNSDAIQVQVGYLAGTPHKGEARYVLQDQEPTCWPWPISFIHSRGQQKPVLDTIRQQVTTGNAYH